MTTAEAMKYWYKAAKSAIGIVLTVNDMRRAQQALYKARRESGDQSLQNLTIQTGPSPGELWLVHKEKLNE
jgi:hypothetical protein